MFRDFRNASNTSDLTNALRSKRSSALPKWSLVSTMLLVLSLAGCGNGWKFTGDHIDKDNYALKIDPAAPILTVGHTVHLTGTSPWGSGADWSVLPAALGTIDSNGTFVAANTPGDGTIVAMWKGDVRYTATAAVRIVAAPDATITTSASIITVNTAATASVPTQPGSTYAWAVTGGVLSGGQNTPQIQFTSAAVGTLQITCTVTNAAGDSANGQKSVTVIDVPPAIQYVPSSYTVTRGQPITPVRPVNTGGAPITWSISPGLLPGLTFDPGTGQITGTPTGLSSPVTYTVTATNSGGSATATITFTAVDAAPTIAYVPSIFTFTKGTAISAVIPTTTGGAITSWAIAPALPGGLVFDPATGIITGTPTVLGPAASYTVTARNTGGTATASLSIRVIDAPPIIHYNPTTQTFVLGSSVGAIAPTNTGGPAISWSISPSLPAGLVFDPATGIITGIPTSPTPTANYTVTASNSGGTSNPVVLTYTVADLAPVFSYNPSSFVYTNGTTITPVLPTMTSGVATTWTISSPLPAGLTFDTASGRISGTPAALSAAVTYLVTATNSYGSSATASITITVLDKPPVIHYNPSVFSLTKGAVFPTLVPTNTGGPAISWAITPGLPAGLVFDNATGTISGTPTTLSASATYSVTATNTGGTSSPVVLSIAVVDLPPIVGYSPSVFVFTKGQPITPIVPANSGGSATSWTLATPLPAGLSFNSTTGAITGTPTALSSAASYSVTATNTGGVGTPMTITITVIDALPVISYPQPTYTFTIGSPISVLVPVNTGGPATSWSIGSSLPAGLVFDPTTGRISGTPTSALPPTAFSVTAGNTGGTSQPTSLTLNLVPAVTAAITASSNNPLYGATVVLTPTFTNAVSEAVGTARDGSDVSASPLNGIGIASAAITSVKTYWLHAANAAGSSLDVSTTVTPQTVALSAITPGSPTRTVSTTTTFSATAAGGVSNGLTWTASGGVIDANTGVWLAPASAATVTITATSKDDASKSVTTVVTVVATGTSSITASTLTPLFGAGVIVTPTFANTTSAIIGTTPGGSDFSAAPTSGLGISTAALSVPTTFYLRITNAAGSVPDVSVTVTPQTVVVGPITPGSPVRSVGTSTNFSATVSGGVTGGLTWTATAGVIDASTGAWTAPAAAATVTIKATSKDDPTKSSSTIANVVAAGTSVITASNTNPLYGAGITLTPTFTNAVTALVGTSTGASDLTTHAVSGTPIVIASVTTAKTYWLHTTNAAGDAIDTSVTVTPQTVFVNPIVPAAPTRSISTTTTFSTTATGGTTNGITWSASAGTMNASTGVWVAPSTAGSVVIAATAKDDSTKSATTSVNVVATVTAAIAVSTSSPLFGGTVVVTPTFANATTATLGTSLGANDLVLSAVTGIPATSSALTTPTTFWLRATNAAGDSIDVSKPVTPKTVAISAITATSINISTGYTTSVQATVTNAVNTNVNWTGLGGVFAPANTVSGVNTTWTAPTTAGTYVLTATSAADTTKSSVVSVTVLALPQASSLAVDNVNPLYGAAVHLLPNFTFGTGTVNNGVGAVTSGTSKTSAALTVPTTFLLTVSNSPGQTATVSSALVTPQTVSVDAPVGANQRSTLTTGNSQAYTAAVHGALNTNVTWTATGGSFAGNIWTAPGATGPYTLTATSVADPTKSNSIVITVVNAPIITMFTAADPLISLNHATTLTALFTNGAGTATIGTTGTGSSNITGAASSSAVFQTGVLTATTTFTLTAYNEAGNSTSASVTVTVVAGSSSPTVSLASPRYAHTSTLLPDGRVLIAGGRSGSSALNSSQIYDATIPSFSDADTMVAARYGHTATLLANNTVLLTGGNNGSSTSAQVELWNGSFASTGNLNTAREEHTATLLLNGKVLIVGGLNGNSPVVSAELYNPATGTFTYTTGNLNTARYSHTATLLANGKVLISGGYSGVALKSAELFDPATGAFTVVGSMSTARQRHAAVLLNDGTVAMIGGQGTSAPLGSAEIFNSSTNTFAAAAGSMASARDGLTATLIASGKVVVAGGIDSTGTPVKGSEILDPSTGTFSLSGLLNVARAQHTANLLQGGKILMVGGLAQTGSTVSAELLDPQDGLSPTIPNAAVTAPVGALRGQAGLVVSVPAQTHVQYVWMITGGTITAGIGTNSITLTMPASGPATVDVLVTSDRLVPSHTQIAVTPKPVISSFAPTKSTLTVLHSTDLNWAVQDAASLSLNQSIGTVTGTSVPVTAGALGSTTYTLTATNPGGSVTATTTVLAVPPPVATSLSAAALIVPVGGNTSLTPTFTQGTGAIDQGMGAVLSGPAYPTVAISTPTTFTLTVTNAAGDVAQRSVTVGLQPVSVTGITGPQYVSAGHAATYTASVTGAVNTAVTWSTAAGAIDASGHLTAPAIAPYSFVQTPLTLTATAVQGGTPGSLTVQIVPLPTITSFTSNLASVTYGGSLSITPVFLNGTGQIVGLGSVTSGQPVSTGTLMASRTYSLIVTNPAGDSVTQTLTVDPGTISVSTPATVAGAVVTTGDRVQFSASTVGSANTAVTWSADGGAFSSNTWTAPAPGTYLITASSVSPVGYSASASITVVAAPTITSFVSADSTLAPNTGTTLVAVFSGGTATINPGGASVVSGASSATGLLASTTNFTLVVSNSATIPKTVSRSLTVNILKGVTSTLSTLMVTARVGHSVTLLADGTVLVAGGSASTVAEVYNANVQTLTALSAPMQSVRYAHTATLMADGRVLLAGGSDGTSAQATAEIFDPSTGLFTATSNPMTTARKNHTAALLEDGRVLLSGGVDASGTALLSTEIFGPIAGTFTPGPALSSMRRFVTSTALDNGRILLAGGDDTSNASNAGQSFDGTAFTNSILVQARSQHTATLLPTGGVLLTGGISGTLALGSTEIFDGTAFAASGNLSTARYGQVANLLAGGQVFITGGTTDGSSALSSSMLFDAIQAQAFATADLLTARFEPSSTILRNGKVLVAGGATNPVSILSTSLKQLELFDPQDNLTPILPSATLTAPTYASLGTTGLVASVQAQSNVRYVWSLTNGTITAGLNTNSIVFTKGAGGPSILSVLVVSDREVPAQSSVTISTAPSITQFTPTPSTNTVGLATTLTWTVTGAPGLTLSLDNGIGDVTALGGATTVITPAMSTIYTLTATDVNGTTTRPLTLHSVPMPVVTGLSAAVNPIEKGSSTTILPTFLNGVATIDNGVGAVLSGVAYTSGSLNTSTILTLTVINSVGTIATRTLAVNVMSVVVGAISGPANVSLGGSAQFSATVVGALDKSVAWSTSAGTITSAGVLTAPASAQDIVLTATSVADPTQHSQTTVHVVGLPVATGIVAATNPVLYGGSTTITAQFSQGTAVIDQGIGSVSAGIAYTTGSITVDKSFTLTVTNSSGSTATFPYTVHPQTVVVGAITGPASGKVTQGRSATFTATVTGAVNTAVTWTSAGVGSWSGNRWTAPNTTGTYVLTATAVNGASNSLSITVVTAPAISSFTAAPAGINKNQSSTLAAVFTGAGSGSNATAVATPGSLSLTSGGVGVSTGALASSQTYTLTVTNDAGDSATAQTTVQIFLGAFSATSNSLASARNLPTATLGPDGNVVIAGGGSASSAADVFNGASQIFAADAAHLLTGRSGQTSTLLPNGLILIAGGFDNTSALASAELYNPADGSFTATGSLNVPRRNHRALLLDSGKVLLAGGTSLNSAEIYDPATALFTPTSAMASVRESATVSRLPDGRVLVAGGFNGSSRLATAEIFDPSSNTFSTAGTMLQGRALHTATTLASGQILIAGGTGTTSNGSAEIFNPSLMRFVSIGNMIQPRQQQIATLLAGGMVLIAGGNNGTTTTAIDQAELFDPSQGSFLKTDFMSTNGVPATGAAATLLPSGQVLVSGGTSNGSTVVSGSEVYTSTDGLSAIAADSTITASTYVPQGSTAVSSHVTAVANARYVWMVSNGTLVSGQGTPSVVFNMAASGNVTLDVLIVTDRLIPSHGHVVVVGEPSPAISSFTAATNPVLYGSFTSITPVFTNALGGSVIGTGVAGSSDLSASVASGVSIPLGPFTAPVQYRLTIANRAGVSVNQTLTVSVRSIIVSAIAPANPILSINDSRTFTASVSQAVNTGIVWSATGGTINASTGAWTAPSTPGIYTIKATSAADNTTSSVTTANVLALPAVQSFTATPISVNYGQAASLLPVFTGSAAGNAHIGTGGAGSSQVSSAAVSGNGLSTGPLTANTSFTLTVTSAAGASVSATIPVTVIQPFSATGPMAIARLGQTTTPLPDGTVLIAGGTDAADVAEVYTASTGSFVSTQSMQTARKRHTATLLPTGKVLLVGGSDSIGALSSAEIFDPSTHTFTLTSGSMIHARQNAVAALLADGRVLIAGGSNATEQQLATAEIFDPSTGTFSVAAGTLSSAREFATATTLVDGRVLVAGGFNGSVYLSTADIFSGGASTTSAISMGGARSHHTASLLPSGKILLSGGYDGENRLATTTLFTPGSPDSFSNAGNLAQGVQDAAATLLAGGKVLIGGGTDGTTSRSSAGLFDQTNTSVTATGSMLTARSGEGSALLLDGTVLVAGGTSDGSTRLASAERFDPQDSLTPFQPNATIVPSVTHATLGATALTATAPSHPGNRYVWFLRNGTITGGQGTPSVIFSMSTAGDALLDLLVLSDHLVPAHSQVTIAADPLPSLAAFTATQNPIPYGGVTTLTAVFSNASGVTLGTTGYGSSDVSTAIASAVPVAIGPLTASTPYTLTFPEIVGNRLSSTLTINVLPVVVSGVSPSNPSVSTSHSQNFSAAVTQAVNTGIVWSATGGTINPATGIWTAPSTAGTYTIKATAAADNLTSSSTTATVVGVPSISSFIASPTTIPYGQSTSLTAVFNAPSGSQATITASGNGSSQLTANAISAVALSSGALTATTTYTLNVTNAAGDSVTSSVVVTVTAPFSSTGPMSLARSGQTTTQLPDGTVLVAGGTAAADRAEIYNAGSGTFSSTTSPMTAARRNHTATLLTSGQILFTGGSDGLNTLATAELYDPSNSTFTATAGSMIHARQNHSAALLPDGRVLLLGGSNPAENQMSTAELFDPETGSFTPLGSSMVVARESATATSLPNGDVLVTGGKGSNGAPLGSAELYSGGDFGAQSFLMRSPRLHHTATLLPGGTVLLSGGFDGVTHLASAEVYNGGSSNSSFASISGSMSTAREQHTANLLANGKLLLSGGSDGTAPLPSAEMFDPASGTFAPAGTPITARSGAGSALLQNGKVLIVGGIDAAALPVASAEVFDPQDGSAPGLPGLSLTTPLTARFSTQQTASILLPPDAFCVWSVENGTLISGAGTSTLTFTMGSTGNTTVHVLVITKSGLPILARQVVTGQ